MASTIRNKKVIIPAVAVIAAALVGLMLYSPSSASAQQSNSTTTNNKPSVTGTVNLPQLIQSQVKVSFSDAANTAASAVGGTVVAGHLGVSQGYLVYTFTVMSNNQMYTVVVDAGNGSVLHQSQGHAIGGMGFGMGHGGMMKHRFGGMQGLNSQSQTPAPSTQSGTAPEQPLTQE